MNKVWSSAVTTQLALVALILAGASGIIAACGDGEPPAENPDQLPGVEQGVDAGKMTHHDAGTLESDAGVSDSDAGISESDAGVSDAGVSDAGTAGNDAIDTVPNLKVALIGDTDSGANFQAVLQLVKAEGAQMILLLGDMSYSVNPTAWYNALDAQMGASFPVFLAAGNHDVGSWPTYNAKLKTRMADLGVTPDDPNLNDEMYSYAFKGLKVVTVGQNGQNAAFTNFVNAQFANDKHTWRVCTWHKNQQAMQVGGKTDEMGWPVYEACRTHGAIIATGHEHSYSRTKTLTSMETQTVDPSCSAPESLCVAPGKTFAFVSGLGGVQVRTQLRCLSANNQYPFGCKGEWASIWTSKQSATFGATFITFNVDGDPKKARGYFKGVNGTVADQFTITKQ